MGNRQGSGSPGRWWWPWLSLEEDVKKTLASLQPVSTKSSRRIKSVITTKKIAPEVAILLNYSRELPYIAKKIWTQCCQSLEVKPAPRDHFCWPPLIPDLPIISSVYSEATPCSKARRLPCARASSKTTTALKSQGSIQSNFTMLPVTDSTDVRIHLQTLQISNNVETDAGIDFFQAEPSLWYLTSSKVSKHLLTVMNHPLPPKPKAKVITFGLY